MMASLVAHCLQAGLESQTIAGGSGVAAIVGTFKSGMCSRLDDGQDPDGPFEPSSNASPDLVDIEVTRFALE